MGECCKSRQQQNAEENLQLLFAYCNDNVLLDRWMSAKSLLTYTDELHKMLDVTTSVLSAAYTASDDSLTALKDVLDMDVLRLIWGGKKKMSEIPYDKNIYL